MKYQVVLEYSEQGVAVSVPGLPGCHSQGANEQEAMQNIVDAIVDYLAVVKTLTKDKIVKEVEIPEERVA